MTTHGKILIGGHWRATAASAPVVNPWTGEEVGVMALAASHEMVEAIDAAVTTQATMRSLPAYRRGEILRRVSLGLVARAEELARTLALETAKPIRDARGEVARAATTFAIAAEEATRIVGETLPLDVAAPGQGRFAISRRFAVGTVAAITPFNFPLNLVAHKLAPAFAAGNTVVLKPAPKTPLSALALGEILLEAGVPDGAINIVTCRDSEAAPLVEDPRIGLLSFTGSAGVGWKLRARAGRKKVVLELGGDAAVVIEPDADLTRAVERTVRGGYAYAGQVCISVQRVFVHEDVYATFRDPYVEAVGRLRLGDPLDQASDLSALIDEGAALRVESWVREALDQGAKLLCGGRRDGNRLDPAVLEDVPAAARLSCEEVFGPVTVLTPYRDLAEALARVNSSRYGLQAGLFTASLDTTLRAFAGLDVGAVIVNDAPSFRVDSMPYGGVKDSGLGREGVRSAIEAMTDLRLLVLEQPPESLPRQ